MDFLPFAVQVSFPNSGPSRPAFADSRLMLASPAIRARAAGGEATLVPLDPRPGAGDAPWPLGPDGFELPAGVPADWPVLGVSWEGAHAYARWYQEEAEAGGGGFEFALPTTVEWRWAAFGGDGRDLAFGDDFDPRWVKSRYARAVAMPEPVLSYPVDESPFGIFDLGGNAREWCADAELGSDGARRALCGGSWLDSQLEEFRIRTAHSAPAETRDPAIGFRLVARRPTPGGEGHAAEDGE